MRTVGGVSYVYDNNGNLTDRGTADDFGWDHENHLTSTTINGVSSTCDYNGDGLRMSRTIGTETTDYIWDQASRLPVVLEDSDVRYVYGLDLIARIDGSIDEYYLTDGLGSTTAVLDDSGNVIVAYAYDAFGNYRPGEGSSTNEFTYAGEQMDETGFQYLRARYYDPAVGRFLSQDPLPLLQPYVYVGNCPTVHTDPSGLCVFGAPCPDVVEEARDEVGNLISAAESALDAYSDTVNGVIENLGYADLNGIICVNGTCVTAGLQASFSDGLQPYWGTGVGTNQGGLSFTVAPGQLINTGLNCGHQHSLSPPGSPWGATVQYGVQDPFRPYERTNPFDYWFVEGGVSYSFFGGNMYDWSATCYWVL